MEVVSVLIIMLGVMVFVWLVGLAKLLSKGFVSVKLIM